jgi:hypothetical protein
VTLRATSLRKEGKTGPELAGAARCAGGASNTLARIDGNVRYSLVLWAMPNGKRLGELDEDKDAREYIQCAGSAAAMTVELRTESHGEGQQFVVGRLPDPRIDEPQVRIPWDEFEAIVYEDEVFTAEEAVELFGSYLETGSVPAKYTLRPLSLARPR